MREYKIHTISIFPVIISLFILILISILGMTYFDNSVFIRTFISIGAIIFTIIIIRTFRGIFTSEIIDDKILKIRWVKKPLLSRQTDIDIDMDNIEKVNHVVKGRQNDFYEIKLKTGDSFSFHQPFFANHNDFIKFSTLISNKINED